MRYRTLAGRCAQQAVNLHWHARAGIWDDLILACLALHREGR